MSRPVVRGHVSPRGMRFWSVTWFSPSVGPARSVFFSWTRALDFANAVSERNGAGA